MESTIYAPVGAELLTRPLEERDFSHPSIPWSGTDPDSSIFGVGVIASKRTHLRPSASAGITQCRCSGVIPSSDGQTPALKRSEERRVGKECRSRWSPYH